MFKGIDISSSALVAQRQRMNTIAGNIAAVNVSYDPASDKEPYYRRIVTFQADTESLDQENTGVGVQYHVKIDTDTPLRKTYDPGHPHADQDGNVTYPNIDMVNEFVNAMEAGRSYEANISAMQMSKEMFNTSLRILA
ncbi:flagellar basal body rod protein FlgC [Gimesia chilikensis]|uniref:flagellar basal body rod protein FlgC n=1 Tax=Gimesia chilikensis TaxID=2605989 RepID=UPI00118777F0|nr:flagellar basal body rod protein FlgC [Gimesia chilikensis]QDT85215.1 Flagellar basal-body rod protein FlgC [Gimesia chilikensis]